MNVAPFRHHGTAKDGHFFKRNIRIDLYQRVFIDDCIVGKTGDSQMMMDVNSFSTQTPLTTKSRIPWLLAWAPGSHRAGRPSIQGRQWPQLGTKEQTT